MKQDKTFNSLEFYVTHLTVAAAVSFSKSCCWHVWCTITP